MAYHVILPQREIARAGCTDLHIVEIMHDRKFGVSVRDTLGRNAWKGWARWSEAVCSESAALRGAEQSRAEQERLEVAEAQQR